MKTKVKKLWVEALRSGKYKKSKGSLKNGEGFCCLGVLTDLYIKEVKKGKWEKPQGATDFTFVGKKESEEMVLPEEVMDWAGLDDTKPYYHAPVKVGIGEYTTLVGLNDDSRAGFKKIASVIEAQF